MMVLSNVEAGLWRKAMDSKNFFLRLTVFANGLNMVVRNRAGNG